MSLAEELPEYGCTCTSLLGECMGCKLNAAMREGARIAIERCAKEAERCKQVEDEHTDKWDEAFNRGIAEAISRIRAL